jgi:hypothetical protein
MGGGGNMNRIKNRIIIALLLVFIVSTLGNSVLSNTLTVQAATLKISKKELTLEVGQSKTLTIIGATKKVTWTSSKKSVATVSSKGKVVAVAAGTVKITAKTNNKKYTCTVNVTKPNPYLEKAPFKAEETKIDKLDFIIPSGWKVYNQDLRDDYIYTEITPPSNSGLNSILRLDIMKQDGNPSDYESFKETFSGSYTKELLTPEWEQVFVNTKFDIIDLTQSDFSAPFNTVLRTQYEVKASGAVVKVTIYDFFIGNYIITLKAEDYDQMDLAAITDYIISSFMISK